MSIKIVTDEGKKFGFGREDKVELQIRHSQSSGCLLSWCAPYQADALAEKCAQGAARVRAKSTFDLATDTRSVRFGDVVGQICAWHRANHGESRFDGRRRPGGAWTDSFASVSRAVRVCADVDASDVFRQAHYVTGLLAQWEIASIHGKGEPLDDQTLQKWVEKWFQLIEDHE